jgi:hypothetical protein
MGQGVRWSELWFWARSFMQKKGRQGLGGYDVILAKGGY